MKKKKKKIGGREPYYFTHTRVIPGGLSPFSFSRPEGPAAKLAVICLFIDTPPGRCRMVAPCLIHGIGTARVRDSNPGGVGHSPRQLPRGSEAASHSTTPLPRLTL